MVFLLLPALPSVLPSLLAAVGLLSHYTEGLSANRYDSRNVSFQIPQIIEVTTPKAVLCSMENPCEKDYGGCKHFCHIMDGEATCTCAAGYILEYDRKHCKLYQVRLPASRLDSRNVSTQKPNITEAITPKTVLGYFENPCNKGNGGCSDFCFIIYGKAKCVCATQYIFGPDGKSCIKDIEGLSDNKSDFRDVSTKMPKIIKPEAVSGSVENPCEKNNGGCDQFCGTIDGEVKCICVERYILGPDGKRCIYTPRRIRCKSRPSRRRSR